MNHCQCGCGSSIADNNKFKHGHNRMGLTHTSETIERIIETNKETYRNIPELRKFIGKSSSVWRKGKTYEQMYGIRKAITVRKRISQSSIGLVKPHWTETYTGAKKKRTQQKTSRSMKATIAHMLGTDPERYVAWRTKNFIGCFTRPSSLERFVIGLKIKHLKYVGNGKVWIKLKSKTSNPDFIVTPYKKVKAVVEVFGGLGYFHTKKEAKTLIKEFKNEGIRCLILFESDLKLPNIKETIVNFINSAKNSQRLHA